MLRALKIFLTIIVWALCKDFSFMSEWQGRLPYTALFSFLWFFPYQIQLHFSWFKYNPACIQRSTVGWSFTSRVAVRDLQVWIFSSLSSQSSSCQFLLYVLGMGGWSLNSRWKVSGWRKPSILISITGHYLTPCWASTSRKDKMGSYKKGMAREKLWNVSITPIKWPLRLSEKAALQLKLRFQTTGWPPALQEATFALTKPIQPNHLLPPFFFFFCPLV